MSQKSDFTRRVEELDRRTGAEAKKHFNESRKAQAWPAIRRSLAAFRKVYYAEGARREGVPGLFRAVEEGMFHFLTYAKHWELERNR